MAIQRDNGAVAEQLEAFAGLLDLSGASPYTARAYRRAAETIRETRAPILELARQGRAQELRGIGPGIAARLQELAETGTIEIAAALGVETTDEFRRAAVEGTAAHGTRGRPGDY